MRSFRVQQLAWVVATAAMLLVRLSHAEASPPRGSNRPGFRLQNGTAQNTALGRRGLRVRTATGKVRLASRRTPVRQMPANYRPPSPALGARFATADENARTILVTHTDGRTHFTSPSMKRAIDARVRSFIADLRRARTQGRRTIYISTPISAAGEYATNLEIAREIGEDLHSQFGDTIHVINPGLLQGLLPAGAHNEDFMHMWELTFEPDLIDEVRFTSNDDIRAYFTRHNQPMPPQFEGVSALAGTGTQYEMQIFGQLIIGRRMSGATSIEARWGEREMQAHELDNFIPSKRYAPQ